MKDKEYKIVGAIQLISESDAAKYGYVKELVDHPVLVYSLTDDLQGVLYFKEDGFNIKSKYQILGDHLIESRYEISEAQIAFPELFL